MKMTLPSASIQGAISYYYLVAFCPPQNIRDLKKASKPLRKRLADNAGMKMGEFAKVVQPEVCRRIAAFHADTRKPDPELVKGLTVKIRRADSNPKKAFAFQQEMAQVAQLPGRADLNKRLHRKKGCHLCTAPCRYGFFTLVSDAQFKPLQTMLEAENRRPANLRDPVNVLWSFTTGHLWQTLGARLGFISVDHLANLSFCLLLLAMARSRFALPEPQLRAYQSANQALIRIWQPAEIDLLEQVQDTGS